MKKYFNMHSTYGIETGDELDSEDFKTHKEFKAELKRLLDEYHFAWMRVYISSRSTKEWREVLSCT